MWRMSVLMLMLAGLLCSVSLAESQGIGSAASDSRETLPDFPKAWGRVIGHTLLKSGDQLLCSVFLEAPDGTLRLIRFNLLSPKDRLVSVIPRN